MATPTPRKRTSDRSISSPADATFPMVQHAQSSAKDYNSISPSTTPQNGPSTHPTAEQEPASADGTAGTLQKPSEPRARRPQSAERAAAAEVRRDEGWWRTFWEKYGSVELENKGSVARDHLALGMFPSITTHTHFRVDSTTLETLRMLTPPV